MILVIFTIKINNSIKILTKILIQIFEVYINLNILYQF